jgi:hypothetical protein
MKDIMTEAEATERWCPLARAIISPELKIAKDIPGAVVNREYGGPGADCYCIASECMAWRLAHKPASNGDETGYCGAFGLPRFT